MAQVVRHWPVNMKIQVQSQAGLNEICGGQSGTGTGFV
jgi:hypothetical protein